MTPKDKLLAFVNRFPDAVTRDEVLYRLDLYLNVELGLKDSEEGKVIDHDELFNHRSSARG